MSADIDSPDEFDSMPAERRVPLLLWIGEHLVPAKRLTRTSSYGLKHCFERSWRGIYVTNGEFKGAMLALGFRTDNERERNPLYYAKTRRGVELSPWVTRA